MHPCLPASADPRAEPPSLGTDDVGYDIYPMPAYVTIPAADVEASATWYVEALGFGVMFVGPDLGAGPVLVHLRRARYQDVLVVPRAPDAPSVAGVSLLVEGDLAAFAAHARAAGDPGGATVEGPVATPWGAPEVRVTDPDGHRLTFFAKPEAPPPSIDDALRGLAGAQT
jgi:catechol 2,3-dioxygenase-like lactoylglutathione lyase family enzyme